MRDSTFITRVLLSNYKSIAGCDVELGSLVFLVGPNGAGKSNFLDALRFVSDALRFSLDYAVRDRGGIQNVRRRSSGHPMLFGIRLEYVLSSGAAGHYAFRIGPRRDRMYAVQAEECVVLRPPDNTLREAYFRVADGEVETSLGVAPAASTDRLYLVNASGLAPFRPVYDQLSQMGFYNLNPQRMRETPPPDAEEVLRRDGSNAPSVLRRLARNDKAAKQRIEAYLSRVVPGVHGVDVKEVGATETLEFRQEVAGAGHPWHFPASNMSDGTLRALGVLTALFQAWNGRAARVRLVGIEEPEVALHPAATGVLLDILREASERLQVLVTSHSPDLLDNKEIEADSILAVEAEEGATRIAPLAEDRRELLRDRLYTAGELLRQSQLTPGPTAMASVPTRQLRLFDVGDS